MFNPNPSFSSNQPLRISKYLQQQQQQPIRIQQFRIKFKKTNLKQILKKRLIYKHHLCNQLFNQQQKNQLYHQLNKQYSLLLMSKLYLNLNQRKVSPSMKIRSRKITKKWKSTRKKSRTKSNLNLMIVNLKSMKIMKTRKMKK